MALALSCSVGAEETTPSTKTTVGGFVSQISQTLKDIKDPQQRLAAAQAVATLARQDAGVAAGEEHGANRSAKAAVGMAASAVAHALNEIKDPAKRLAAGQALLALAQKGATEEPSKHAEDADHDDHGNKTKPASASSPDKPTLADKVSRPERPEKPEKPEKPGG
jgi:hypothetical protein